MKTGEILAVHDVVVQKLINKARDDLGRLMKKITPFALSSDIISTSNNRQTT